jgi:nucleoid-associated protein YgaU
MAQPGGAEPAALAPAAALLDAAGAIPAAPVAPTGPVAPAALQSGGALPGSALAQTPRVLNPVTARLVVDVFSRLGPMPTAQVTAGVVGGQTPLELPVAAQGNRFTVEIPLGERVVVVSVADRSGRLFGEEVSYAVSASGLSQLRATPNVAPAPAPVPASGTAGGARTPEQHVSVFLSRARDVTAEAERVLGRSWTLPSRTIEVLDDPPAAAPSFSPRAVAPSPVRVLELAGVNRPQLVAVCWPANLNPAAPAQFLVYLHHRIDQNRGAKFGFLFERDGQRYPWGRDFLEFGFMRYLDYAGSPLDGLAGGKGLAYQLAASGKPVALVLPMPHFSPDDSAAGELRNAATLEDVLLEIAAHRARQAGATPSERLNRVALASFSSGISDQIEFLQRNGGHRFYREVLRELYRFEGVEDEEYLTQAVRWAGSGSGDDRAVRIYRQLEWSPERSRKYTEKGFALWPSPGRRTFAALTSQVWRAVPAKVGPFFEAEADIANTMLVDALRSSGF